MRGPMALLLSLVLLVVAGTSHALAQSTSLTWQRYDVALTVQPDGSIGVVETQTIRFQGSFSHGFRVIPLDRTTGITDVSLAEIRDGQRVAYAPGSERANTFATSQTAEGLGIDWWFSPARDQTRTFELRYIARGATRVYQDTAQVQWKAIYADRPGPVVGGTVTVQLPDDVQPSDVLTAGYTFASSGGLPREVGTGQLTGARTLNFEVGNLPSGTGYEVRAQVPRALVPTASAPPWQAAAERDDWVAQSLAPIGTFLALLLTLAAIAGGGVALFVLWYSQGREPDVRSVPPRLEDPPSDLPAPLVGTLVDGVADLEDAVATLVDLAQRGVISLKNERGDVRVSLHSATEDPGLHPYERVLLVALFGQDVSSGEIMLSSARMRFAAAVPVLEERLYQGVADQGLFVANPEAVRRRYMALGWTIAAAGLVLGVVGALTLGWAVGIAWLPGAAVAVVGVALVMLARAMPRRTPRGALEARRWEAFRSHLLNDPVDARSEDSLPYAVAFGIDRDYLKRLEVSPAEASMEWGHRRRPGGVIFLPGGWYGGPGYRGQRGAEHSSGGGVATSPSMPSPQGWSDALADLLNSASEAMSHGGGSGRWSGGGWGGGGGGGGGRGGFN